MDSSQRLSEAQQDLSPPKKYTASKVATTVPLLEQHIQQIEENAQRDIDELLRRDAWIQLGLTALLSLCRWAYAVCKHQGSEKRMANFKQLGEALKEAIAEIEPEF